MRAFIGLALLLVAVSAMPQEYEIIPIVRDNREGPVDGAYSFEFETADGVVRSESGSPDGPEGTVVQRGSWSFTFPDGTPAEFTFTADENGYKAESSHIPEIPAHALEQIKKAAEERAAGIIHDGSWNAELYAR